MEEVKVKKPSLIDRFRDPDFKISRKGKWYSIAPLCIIIAGLIVFLTINFNLGLDFTGGRILTVQNVNYDTDRAVIREIFRDEGWTRANQISMTRIEGYTTSISIEFQNRGNDARMDEVAARIQTRIIEELSLQQGDVTPAANISARASGERVMNTFIAVIVALVAILIYMLFRFKFTSGVSAVIALMHDVLMMLALTAIFRVPVNAAFIAAIITVIAYSLNNTLILFDRIRGIEKNNEGRQTTEEMVDRGVKETFTRTMNTTITTIVPILTLIIVASQFIFGVPLIREFALPILFGLIAGTFSTIFISSSLYVRFEEAKNAAARRKLKATSPATRAKTKDEPIASDIEIITPKRKLNQ